jgi:hypothetical protein
VAALLASAGCQQAADQVDDHGARTAVDRYVEALVTAYRTGQPEALEPVATEAERSRAKAVIDGLAKEGRRLEARPLEVEVEGSRRLMEDLFEVTTRERWRYEHRAISAPDRPATARQVTYRMSYQVRRVGRSWVVSSAVER